jgi:hypothetical protein
LGDALSERDRDRIQMKALSRACPELGRREPYALPALSQTLSETLRELEGSIIEGSSVEGRLKKGHGDYWQKPRWFQAKLH